MLVAAIDQGTTSTRTLLVDQAGNLRVAHSLPHQQYYPQEGWVEHDPLELLNNVRACVQAAGAVAALGIDNQGESCLAWRSDTRKALTPVIVWQDKRSLARTESMKEQGLEAETLSRAGLPLDPYFSASKLGWIMQHVPEAREAWRQGKLRLGTSDAYFLDCLTNRFVTDITTASRTSLMNLRSGQWDADLCQLFGVPIECLPEIVPSTGDFGVLHGTAGDIPLTASIVDQQAALYGFHCQEPGQAKITFGTGAFALMCTGHEIHHHPEKGLLPTVAWQKNGELPVYALDGGVYTASAAINWARSLGLFNSFDAINRFESGPAIDSGLVFVPALSGLGCPHWDPRARGQWLGLCIDHGTQQLVQSILEGVAFRAAEVLEAMSSCVARTGALQVDGGMSRNPYFVQFLADILACPVNAAAVPELTGLGTALLAADGAGIAISSSTRFSTCLPQNDRQSSRQRFAEAVAISRQWGQH